MKDAGNPTRWQVAGVALAAVVVAAGVALATPVPRLVAGGEPGGVVRTVQESPDRRARLADLVRQAGTANDRDAHGQSTGDDHGDHHDGEPGAAEPTDDEPTPTEPSPTERDASVDEEPPREEDPPTQDGDGDAERDGD